MKIRLSLEHPRPVGLVSRRSWPPLRMRHTVTTERAASSLVLVLASACAHPSIEPDLARVRALTGFEELASVPRGEVDPETDEEVRRRLEAPLDAEGAVRIALLNNRELRASLRELGVARGDLLQAGLIPNPVVEAELFPERQTEVELRLEYEITGALLAPVRASVAKASLEAERRRVAGLVVELAQRVRGGFYALQGAQDRLAVAQRMLDAFAAGRDAAQALLEAGNVPAVDLAVQEAAYQRARIRVARMELDVATRREAMQRLLGLHGAETAWKPRGGLPPLPERLQALEAMERKAVAQSLELGELRSRLQATAAQVGLARLRGWLPRIVLDVHALYGRPDVPAAEVDDPWRLGTGVSLTLPVFDRFQGESRAREAQLEALLERYHGMAIDVRSRVRDGRNHVTSAHARARHYAEVIVPTQERVTREMLLQYNAMQVGVFGLLQALREQQEAELEAVAAREEYWTASAGLDAILAGRGAGLGAGSRTGISVPMVGSGAGGH